MAAERARGARPREGREVVEVRIGGESVMVTEGWIEV